MTLSRNFQGMLVAFWSTALSSKDVLTMAQMVWSRLILECDTIKFVIIWGLYVWERGGWWRVIVVWLLHLAQYCHRDALSGLTLSLQDRNEAFLAPCLLAHRNHLLPLFHSEVREMRRPTIFGARHLEAFLTTNAVVRSRATNNFLPSHRIAWIGF